MNNWLPLPAAKNGNMSGTSPYTQPQEVTELDKLIISLSNPIDNFWGVNRNFQQYSYIMNNSTLESQEKLVLNEKI